LALVAIAYWLAVQLGLLVVAQPEGVASIWPASGLALAVLLLSPKRQWSILLTIIFVTNALGNLMGGNSLPVSLGFALANALEALLAAWLLTHFCKSRITFGRIVEIFFLFGVAIVANGLTALLGASVSALAFGAPFTNTWLVWWTSDGLGMILVAPLIVTWATSRSMFQTASWYRIVEAILLVLTLFFFTWLLFGSFTNAVEPFLRNYMLFPFLIWLAFRYGPRDMASALTLIAFIAIWNTLQGYGIFGFPDQTVTQHLISAQMLLIVLSFTGMLLSAIVTERNHAGQELKNYSEQLEEMVAARTRALSEAQDKLMRQEKLAVLGQLAGGVGHELRNPLAVINNAAYYLKLIQPDASGKVKDYLGLIDKETRNAGKIISDLLDFARVKSVEREAFVVSELVQRTLVRFPVPESVTTVLELPADLPHGFADPLQMEQVLGNLVVNACQAMQDNGSLTISARLHQNLSGIDAPGAIPDSVPGGVPDKASPKGEAAGDGESDFKVDSSQMISIAVQDTGVGIPPENMSKLFEPLFTTKAKGIGLGLAVSQKLVEANDGRIKVESQPGHGSTFTLYLPVSK
jgi:signal transduction histidine kinase